MKVAILVPAICQRRAFLMMSRLATMALIALFIPEVFGQEFQPFSSPRISEAQWQSYYYQVDRAHGESAQRLPDQLVEVFRDPQTNISWVFTQLGHPAHPAWIARRTTGEGEAANVQQVGYFAGNEAPFAEFFNLYLGRVSPQETESGKKKKK